jgi:hypothetical protein
MNEPGLAALIIGTLAAANAPAFFILLDHHKKHDIHKAVLFILALYLTFGLMAWLPGRWPLRIALMAPGLVFAYAGLLYIWGERRRKNNDKHL